MINKIGRSNVVVFFMLALFTILLMAMCYYSPARYVGDTALYAQITKNISVSGEAVSNIHASTQDFIDRNIAAIPIDERIENEASFTPPKETERNILSFHSCFILYLMAPLCYIMSPYACVTFAQCLAMAFSLIFFILILHEKKVPIWVIFTACLLVISHPGWSMPAVYGAFYPERIFMGTGMYLIWACERTKFCKIHFVVASLLCLLVGERGALYAGMFILAYTIFYWKSKEESRRLRLLTGCGLVVYTGFVMKFVLSNLYYSDISDKIDLVAYMAIPGNMEKVLLFLGINILFIAISVFFDWRAAVIGLASMIPNLLYDNGGAEKIGWTLHYHVFYFVFLIWAVSRGIIALCDFTKSHKLSARKRVAMQVGIIAALAVVMSTISPFPSGKIFALSNMKNNIMYSGTREIYSIYVLNGRDARSSFDDFIDEHIREGMKVTTIEAAMPSLLEDTVYLFPMGLDNADAAIMSYQEKEGEYIFRGAVTYAAEEESRYFDTQIVEKMKKLGYNFEDAVLFPAYGIAIIKRN